MCKRLFLLTSLILLLVGAPSFAEPDVGIFSFTTDVGEVGNPLGIGSTQYVYPDQYLITAGGSDIWDNHDHFHYAYNEISGDVRIEASPTWQDAGWNDWAKAAVMLRDTTALDSIFYVTSIRKGPGDPWIGAVHGTSGDGVFAQGRVNTGAGPGWDTQVYAGGPDRVAIQRGHYSGIEMVQSLADWGDGWEVVATTMSNLPEDALVGLAVTAHDNAWLVQARFDDVVIGDADIMQDWLVIPEDVLGCDLGDKPGFLVHTVQNPAGYSWVGDRAQTFEMAEWLVKNDGYPDDPATVKGTDVRALVNLHDSGGRFEFHEGNGFPDESFPGIDTFESPTADPANGDAEDQFATLITACIELTEGLHVIGGHSDDGVLIRIGGVEIGRTASWNTVEDFLFEVEAAGMYSLEAIMFEGGGGADLELYEVLTDGTRILLGDVENGGSPVYVPEPATIALLGFGGLSMLRIRKKR